MISKKNVGFVTNIMWARHGGLYMQIQQQYLCAANHCIIERHKQYLTKVI